jgi:hypothetical protein
MATLDVNDAFDLSFLDVVTILRRPLTIDQHGRGQATVKPLSITAVVTAASPADLQRLPEGEHMNKAISIYPTQEIQGPAIDEIGTVTHPDQVLWHGSLYVVRYLEDYSGYGRGFVHALATSMQSIDPPPPFPNFSVVS